MSKVHEVKPEKVAAVADIVEKLKNAQSVVICSYSGLLLPAMGTLYFALASIWHLPYGEQVVGTITAVDTFLGVILGITTAQYKQKQKTDAA